MKLRRVEIRGFRRFLDPICIPEIGDGLAARFPVAAELSDAGISLPVGPHLAPGDAARVGAVVSAAVREARR